MDQLKAFNFSKLPNLTSLNFEEEGEFHPDDRGNDTGLTNNRGDEAYCPDVPNVTNYNIRINDFRSVDLNSICLDHYCRHCFN